MRPGIPEERAMTLVRQSPATRPATLDAALATVRAHGLRASSARRLLLAALVAAERPIPAEAIARGLDGRVPPSDVASVYRNLDALERIGIVRRLHAGHGAALYTLAGGDDGGYVACERCGEVRSASPLALASVRTAVRTALGYEASFLHVPIVGLCPNCAHGGRR
jgi:Fur family ferric uptake transcriptional regulator